MTTRRFIAGAVCPRCGVMDRIVVFDDEDGKPKRECIDCGFNERMPDYDNVQEMKTRVTPKQSTPSGVSPIKFFPRPPKSQK